MYEEVVKNRDKDYRDDRLKSITASHIKLQNYCIFRIGAKYHSFTQVSGFERHMERKQETLNADPERIAYNRIIKGSPDITENLKDYLKDVKLRKNSVIATSMLLTASHNYFNGMMASEKEKWIQKNVKWLYDTFGEDRILYISVHEDERTPHINVLFSAKVYDQKKNIYTLANRRFLGGRDKLQNLQDNYARAMQPLGLVRGIRHSKMKHIQIRQYYALLNKKIDIKDISQVAAYATNKELVENKIYELQKTLDLYKRHLEGKERDNILLAAKLGEVQKDKQIYGEAIKAMSALYKIPQSSIKQIITYATNDMQNNKGKELELSDTIKKG